MTKRCILLSDLAVSRLFKDRNRFFAELTWILTCQLTNNVLHVFGNHVGGKCNLAAPSLPLPSPPKELPPHKYVVYNKVKRGKSRT